MRTEGIGNKLFLIALLCAALALFLILRPRLFAPEPQAQLIDRLPEDEILGRFYLLDVANESSSMLFYHKVPFRDLVSPDFILSQAKSYGLDIQKPGYFFANRSGEWGTFLNVTDSSRVQNGLVKLSQYVNIEDTTVLQRNLHYIPAQKLFIFYDKNYILFYHGTKIRSRLARCVNAKSKEIGEGWKKFEAIHTFKDDKLVVFAQNKQLRKYGIEYGLFAHDSDSLSFKLKSYIKTIKPHKLKLKESGPGFEQSASTTKMLDLHLDVSEFRKDKKHPFYQWIVEKGRKIGFPTDAFFAAWEGDISFQQGGTQLIDEEVIETGYNEEFEMVETRTIRKVPVAGFSLMLSMNDQSKTFINSLFARGIITKQDKKYHFLFSPPLTLNILSNSLSAYSSTRSPHVKPAQSSRGLWKYKGTPVAFSIDSLRAKEVFGSIEFPVNRLIRRSKFFR